MKRLLVFIIIAAALIGCKKKEDSSATDTSKQYVISQNGINLRDKPDTTATSLTVIPYGEMVTVKEKSSEEKTINSVKGFWNKVSWKDKTGWVFGGFIRPKAKNEPVFYFYQCLPNNLGYISERKFDPQNPSAPAIKLELTDFILIPQIMPGDSMIVINETISSAKLTGFKSNYSETAVGTFVTMDFDRHIQGKTIVASEKKFLSEFKGKPSSFQPKKTDFPTLTDFLKKNIENIKAIIDGESQKMTIESIGKLSDIYDCETESLDSGIFCTSYRHKKMNDENKFSNFFLIHNKDKIFLAPNGEIFGRFSVEGKVYIYYAEWIPGSGMYGEKIARIDNGAIMTVAENAMFAN